jgi:small GTP-binding protein
MKKKGGRTMQQTNHLVIGLLAHVDAGKTTLSEAMLYLSGTIRSAGRVDKRNAFLDNFDMERERGITIFSKQAKLTLPPFDVTLLDTPGHVDFSAEMERTLQVLDYAVLIISGADGVQAHTLTLWKLLERYQIPVFLFINKMDQEGCEQNRLLQELQKELSPHCLAFPGNDIETFSDECLEQIAMCQESLMEAFLNEGTVSENALKMAIKQRDIFPCYFGSALKMEGIQEFMEGIATFSQRQKYPNEFGAKIFKITRDEQGNRVTHLKITGGALKVKELLEGEKINQIRIYSGKKYEAVQAVTAGEICGVLGMETGKPGQGIGVTAHSELPTLEPVLHYRLILPEDCDANRMLPKLRELEEEEPQLHIVWNEQLQEIQVQLMGEVQIDVLKRQILERFDVAVEFGEGRIVYKETIADIVEGVGHFEPLKHYAEVHLKLEPAEAGTGLQFDTAVSEDVLERNWQRLILTHLQEKNHKGVLTGSDITDMRITIVAGRAHTKHTEGGDFRQATYRAVRQGLMQATSVLLEPVYAFRLVVPMEQIGRGMTDMEGRFATCEAPLIEDGTAILTGIVPVSTVSGYQREVLAYTGGKGTFSCTFHGYAPCHNQEEVVQELAYNPQADLANPSGSVFCAHGAGFVVEWFEVEDYMHLEKVTGTVPKNDSPETERIRMEQHKERMQMKSATGYADDPYVLEDELKSIFERTYGVQKAKTPSTTKRVVFKEKETIYKGSSKKKKEEYLLVDGYNVIFAWEDLKDLACINMDAARDALLDAMCNYQGYKQNHLMVVFDAYKVKGFQGEVNKYHNIEVVFTKEAETADHYIEKFAHRMGKQYDITVATSDGLEQMIIMGQGCRRMSSRELKQEVEEVNQKMQERYVENTGWQSENRLHNKMQIPTAATQQDF